MKNLVALAAAALLAAGAIACQSGKSAPVSEGGVRQQNLQAEYDVIQRAAPSLSKVELERAQMDFQRIQNNYQMLEQQKSGELQQIEMAINETVKEQVDKAIEAMKGEEQIDLVLIYETNILYGSEGLDYTIKLAEYLNKLPKPEAKDADKAGGAKK